MPPSPGPPLLSRPRFPPSRLPQPSPGPSLRGLFAGAGPVPRPDAPPPQRPRGCALSLVPLSAPGLGAFCPLHPFPPCPVLGFSGPLLSLFLPRFRSCGCPFPFPRPCFLFRPLRPVSPLPKMLLCSPPINAISFTPPLFRRRICLWFLALLPRFPPPLPDMLLAFPYRRPPAGLSPSSPPFFVPSGYMFSNSVGLIDSSSRGPLKVPLTPLPLLQPISIALSRCAPGPSPPCSFYLCRPAAFAAPARGAGGFGPRLRPPWLWLAPPAFLPFFPFPSPGSSPFFPRFGSRPPPLLFCVSLPLSSPGLAAPFPWIFSCPSPSFSVSFFPRSCPLLASFPYCCPCFSCCPCFASGRRPPGCGPCGPLLPLLFLPACLSCLLCAPLSLSRRPVFWPPPACIPSASALAFRLPSCPPWFPFFFCPPFGFPPAPLLFFPPSLFSFPPGPLSSPLLPPFSARPSFCRFLSPQFSYSPPPPLSLLGRCSSPRRYRAIVLPAPLNLAPPAALPLPILPNFPPYGSSPL